MSSLPNNREVWRIAAPMMLSNISVPLLGMVDTGVTGHLEDARYLAAVAIGSAIFGFIFFGFNFLRMGTTGITAQRFGADDHEGLKVALGQALIVSFAIALVIIVLQVPIADLSMGLLGADSLVVGHAYEYFYIRIWSAPATLANFVLIGWFLGLQNARVPLYIVLVINLTNIVLDLFFVLVLNMDVDGVAAASVIAEIAGPGRRSCFRIQTPQNRQRTFSSFKANVPLGEYKAFFAVNAHLLVRTMALIFTFFFVTAAGARMGAIILAANASAHESDEPDVIRVGRSRPCCRGFSWQGGRQERSCRAQTIGDANTALVTLFCSRFLSVLFCRRTCADSIADGHRRRCCRHTRLSTMDDDHAAYRFLVVSLRRCFCRGNSRPRNARHHAGLHISGFHSRVVSDAIAR